jgi:hypothetical protein
VERDDVLSDDELGAADARADAATRGPWESSVEGRDHDSGDSVILTPGPDLYISYDQSPDEQQRAADLDFIAAARQDVPRLVAQVRRLRALLRREQ